MSYKPGMARFSVEISGEAVTVRRKALGLTQAHLGLLAGVTRQTIAEVEGGNYNPSTALALRLALLLDTRVEDLFRLPPAEVEALLSARKKESRDGNS
jgi:putative transcriptional regulator